MGSRKFEVLTNSSTTSSIGTERDTHTPDVHHLPMKLEYEGAANVKDFFTNYSTPHLEVRGVLTNKFRGRPLMGTKLDLPPEYKGYVASPDLKLATSLTLNKDNSELESSDESDRHGRNIQLMQEFDSLTYWNWDKAPSSMDAAVKLQDWLHISEILHGPVDN